MQCITMIHRSVGAALLLCRQACGGHSSTFTHHLSLSFPPSPLFFPALHPHFLSSFCSVTLSLLSLPLSLSCTNVLSHHCFSSLLSPSNAHTPSLEFVLLPLHSFTFGGRPFSLVHSLFLLQSLMLISIARLPLFVVDFLIDTKSFTPSSSVSSK